MQCLINTIGILGCDAPTPSTGEYVNDLPGITSFMVGKIASNEKITYLETWNNIKTRAVKRFRSAVISAFKNDKKLKIKTVSQSVDIGRYITTDDNTAASVQYRGIAIEIAFPANSFQYLESLLQVIYIQSLSLYSTAIKADFQVKIFDLDTGATLQTLTQTLAVGWNSIPVAASYDSKRILIAYDATTYESVTLTINQGVANACQFGCDTVFGYGNCEANINGATTSDLADVTTIEKSSNAYGLSAIFSIQCRYDYLVCNNLDQFTLAWQLLLGAEVMRERIYSDRENRYTGIDLEKAKELRTEFEKGFETELSIAVSGIDISENDCCVECVDLLQKVYTIP